MLRLALVACVAYTGSALPPGYATNVRASASRVRALGPGAIPFAQPTVDDTFVVANSSRFHNRPLYGDHNGGLVLTGDRAILHLADDHTIYGGFLAGLVAADGTGVWLHNADNILSTYAPGTQVWAISDSAFPGVTVTAATLPLANGGLGAVFDLNVTTTGAAVPPGTQLVWTFACGAAASGGQTVGWSEDPLIHPEVMNWTFTPAQCAGNHISLNPPGNAGANRSYSYRFGSAAVAVDMAPSSSGQVALSLAVSNASNWADITAFSQPATGYGTRSSAAANTMTSEQQSTVQQRPLRAAALPVAGALLWLRASSLQGAANGSAVTAWPDDSGNGYNVTQTAAAAQPVYRTDALGAGVPGVVFDGMTSFLANNGTATVSAGPAIGSESTMFAIFRDDGSSGGSPSPCCSGVVFFSGSYNGIATLPAASVADDDDAASGPSIVTKLDYAGSAANGHTNVYGRLVVAMSVFTAHGQSNFSVDGCSQGSVGGVGAPGQGVLVGARNDEMQRFFRGVIGEVVVFNRTLSEAEVESMLSYFAAAWPTLKPKKSCSADATPAAVAAALLPPPTPTGTTTRFTWSFKVQTTPAQPVAELAAAQARVASLIAPVTARTPEPLINAAVAALQIAIDGLWRNDPPVFLHAAMAWDVPLVGWRSQMGAVAFSRRDLVEQQVAYMTARQVQPGQAPNNTQCVLDATKLLTQEAANSRLYGTGRIKGGDGMYDMQSQFFAQAVECYQWGATNATYGPMLYPALSLHAQWAHDCFNQDGNGLFQSYINTWPTDSQFYSGGETVEETAYMLMTHEALHDLALAAGNATDAALHAAAAATIRADFPSLWVVEEGHPAASREEGGLQRLRPDAWTYSVFLAIEAGLLNAEEAAQALHFTEWGQQRDTVYCDEAGTIPCGVLVWTSNWVPSQWSVRQLWGGDSVSVAHAYFLAGLPDDGYEVLQGTMRWMMLQMGVPGQAGGANGAVDFNDCVHPLARTLIEGFAGYRPMYGAANPACTVAPQFPSSWPNASWATPDFALQYTAAPTSMSLVVQLTQPLPGVLQLQVPIRAAALDTASLVVTVQPGGLQWNYSVQQGYGQSILVVSIIGSAATPVTAGGVGVNLLQPLPYQPSVHDNATTGASLLLTLPAAGLQLVNFSDPQGVLVPGTGKILPGGTSISGTVAANASGWHMIIGYAVTSGNLPQMVLFKLNITDTAPAVPLVLPLTAEAAAAATWAYVPLQSSYNGDLRGIYAPNQYLSPRPETCGVRIGSDGWSAWTFPYWGGPAPPTIDFSGVNNITVAPGPVIATPQGAQFLLSNNTVSLPAEGEGRTAAAGTNVAFASLWDNYPSTVNVTIPGNLLPGATSVWVLLAGSTDPMKGRIANGVLRYVYSDGTVESLELTPPLTFWSMSGWGTADYDYTTDAFCLPPVPPPTVQLGAGNRAMVYGHTLLPSGGSSGVQLLSVQLEVVCEEVVMGILAVSLMQ